MSKEVAAGAGFFSCPHLLVSTGHYGIIELVLRIEGGFLVNSQPRQGKVELQTIADTIFPRLLRMLRRERPMF